MQKTAKPSKSPVRTEMPAEKRPRAKSRIVRAVGIVGRVLVVLGAVVLLYTAYLLWGTSVYTSQQQARLTEQLAQQPVAAPERHEDTGQIQPAVPDGTPNLGDPIFRLVAPKIALDTVVVQGVRRDDLRKGPGRYPQCGQYPEDESGIAECVDGQAWPGGEGNLAISGHRTTYGAPFFRIDELTAGEEIQVVSGGARYKYRVSEQKIISPYELQVLENRGKSEITLIACHPRFSAAQRIVVHADFLGAEPVNRPPPVAPKPAPGADEETAADGEASLVPSSGPVVPVDVLALVAIAIVAALGAMALSHRLRKWAILSGVSIATSALLWVAVFPQILRLMPANY